VNAPTPGTSMRGMTSKPSALCAAALLALVGGGWAGCASHPTRSSTVIQPPTPPGLPKPPALRLRNPPGVEPASVGSLIRVEKDPPPAPQEMPTSAQPFAGAVWVPGYYVWQNNQYTWLPGRWERPPEGRSVWVAPRWERRDNGYAFIEGYWR
jgi:hypothetical protein